jgi:hypothetical protein
MILASLLSLLCIGWMAALIWRRSALLAMVSLLAWPVFFFACLRYWGDEYSDIRVPFAMFVPALWIAATWV